MCDPLVFEEGITKLFSELYTKYLITYSDKKRSLITHKNFDQLQVCTVKKVLYQTLFTSLHAPHVPPIPGALQENEEDESEEPSNPYHIIAKTIFNLRLSGFREDAERLSILSQELKRLGRTPVDNALLLLQLLSNCPEKVKSSNRVCYRKDNLYTNNMFQFDKKAFGIDESGIDLFGSVCDVNAEKFAMSSFDPFSMKPGSMSERNSLCTNQRMKESKFSRLTRLSLFGGLASGLSSSLDVVLNLPKLPEFPSDLQMQVPSNSWDLYKEESLDEGFHEISSTASSSELTPFSCDSLQLEMWDEAMKKDGEKRLYKWEKDGSYDQKLNNRYLTELGDKAFDCMYKVKLCEIETVSGKVVKEKEISQEKIFRDSLNVLIGVQSSTYSFHPSSFSMKPASNIRSTGKSADSLHGLMTKFAWTGTCYQRLRKFCSHHTESPSTGKSGGTLLKAFIDALNEVLQSYWFAVFTAADIKDLMLTELWHLFERFSGQLKLLSDICLCSEAFRRTKKSPRPKFPVGPGLLSYLYSLAVKNSSTEHYPVLLYLFKATAVPYIQFISNWLFDGKCLDPFGEFFVFLDDQYLNNRDKYFWTQGFQMKQSKSSIPLFLDDMAQNIFACGKALNLLKLVNIKHYLFDKRVSQPRPFITFSSHQLDVVERSTKYYIQEVQQCQRKEEEEREKKKVEEQEAWRQKIATEKTRTQEAITEIQEMEGKIQQAVREKKGKELKRLKEQFEAAVKERQSRRKRQLEEDQQFLKELKQIEDKEDEVKRKAREDLVSFYQQLFDQADKRERRSRWIIERYELADKRTTFLLQQTAQLDVEVQLMREKIAAGVKEMNGIDEVDTSRVNKETRESYLSGEQKEPQMFEHRTDKARTPNGDYAKPPTYSTDIPDNPSSSRSDLSDVIVSFDRDDVIDRRETEPEIVNKTLAESPSNTSQNTSQAKGLLYPEQSNETNVQQNSTLRMKGAGSSLANQSISTAQNLLYPSSEVDGDYQSKQSSSIRNQNLSTAQNLLYPSSEDTRELQTGPELSSYQNQYTTTQVDRRSALGSSAFEGSNAKDIMYSTGEGDKKPVSHQYGAVEGAGTKSLLYPGDISSSTFAEDLIKQRYVEEGAETKNLLYPAEITTGSPTQRLTKNPTRDGSQTKNLLYTTPYGDTRSPVFSGKGAIQVDAGMQVKDALYPGDMADTSTLYKGQVSGMYSEGGETKGLLYPDSLTQSTSDKKLNSTSNSWKARQTFESVTSTTEVFNKSRQFQKSTVEKLIYPDTYDYDDDEDINVGRTARQFEPATTIKEMMYPKQEQQKERPMYVPTPLRPEDVWMDLAVEPYFDDYSVIDKDPHPYKSFELSKSYTGYQSQSHQDKNADIIKKFPLETIIKRSLTTPIQAQISLVNKATIKYFIDDLRIRGHFDAFRKFLLLEDGEFGHSLFTQLFQKISSGMKPQEFCNAIHLNNIIIEALRLSLYASRIEYSTQLTFSLKSVPEVFQPSDVGVLDFLELRYQVPWPCNIIVTENSITKYNKVFSFLTRLKRANWSLQEVWVNLKKAGRTRQAAASPQLRQLQLYRHEMQHFVNNLERYIVNQIIHVSWEEFQQELEKNVNSLDDLHRCHTNYQFKIVFRSLLSKNASPVYKLINDIFGMISKFEARLTMSSWVADKESGNVTHLMFAKLKSVYGEFKKCIDFLFSVISKLVKRGYQDHLADLLLQVNFNDHYSTAIIH